MKIFLKQFSSKDRDWVKKASHLADRTNVPLYLVGGIVRDLCLKKKVAGDLDFLIVGDAVTFAKDFARIYGGKCKVYQSFGTATVIYQDRRIDFTTARSEKYPRPGVLPVVTPGTLDEDLRRRDFTVNALAMVVNTSSFGNVVDVTGGLKDLKQKTIRVLHDKSFRDDPTRILRAVRFEQRLGFQIEPVTLRWLKQALKENHVKAVKPPRYFREFRKILFEADPVKPLKRLCQLKGLSFVTARKPDFKKCDKLVRRIRQHNGISSENDQSLMLLMVLLSKESSEQIIRFCRSVQISKKEEDVLKSLPLLRNKFRVLRRRPLRDSVVYKALKDFPQATLDYLLLSEDDAVVKKHVRHFVYRLQKVELKMGGHEIRQLDGLKARKITEVREKMLEAKLDGKVSTKREEKKYAQMLVRKG